LPVVTDGRLPLPIKCFYFSFDNFFYYKSLLSSKHYFAQKYFTKGFQLTIYQTQFAF